MILRRVIEHVKTQNWTAVALDFVIVVMGVFIGVQVNGWWAGRSDAERERAYLSALRDDFDVIIAELDGDSDQYESIAAAMDFLLEQSRKPTPDASMEALNDAAQLLVRMEGTPIASGTYDNLTGSGDLAIIKSQKIKNGLTAFYSSVNVIDLVGNTHEMQLVNIFQPYIVANLDYTGMLSETRGIKPAAAFDRELVFAALPTREFRNVVAVKWDISTDIRNLLQLSLVQAREMRALLDEEIMRHE